MKSYSSAPRSLLLAGTFFGAFTFGAAAQQPAASPPAAARPAAAPLPPGLEPGFTVRIDREGGDSLRLAAHGGFLSVRKDGVSVLAEMAEAAEDIDVSPRPERRSTERRTTTARKA